MYRIDWGFGPFKQSKYFHTWAEAADYCRIFKWSTKRQRRCTDMKPLKDFLICFCLVAGLLGFSFLPAIVQFAIRRFF